MVPRGQVHCFVTEFETAMDMVRANTGLMPAWVLVDEACATKDGDRWSQNNE